MTKNLNLLILAVALLITACDKQDAQRKSVTRIAIFNKLSGVKRNLGYQDT